jgi:hypothetical protein
MKLPHVTVGYYALGTKRQLLTLRRIRHLTKNDRVYMFIMNEFRLPAEGIAVIIKNRLMIEIFVQSDQSDIVGIDNGS